MKKISFKKGEIIFKNGESSDTLVKALIKSLSVRLREANKKLMSSR